MRKVSWSMLQNYERCPYTLSTDHKKVNAISAQHKSDAAQRGINIHKEIEAYLNHADVAFADEFFASMPFSSIRDTVIAEVKITLDKNWAPKASNDDWLITILDGISVDKNLISATIYDWKTGKSANNELKHRQQMQLYMCAAIEVFPVQSIRAELWYVDEQKIVPTSTYTPEQLKPIKERFHKRLMKASQDAKLNPNPTKSNCKFCNFAGVCQYEYQ